MKVEQILKHLESLPKKQEFDWAGKEHWHEHVFAQRVQTLPEAIEYIKALKDRLADVTFALSHLVDAYNEIINWIRQIEIYKE